MSDSVFDRMAYLKYYDDLGRARPNSNGSRLDPSLTRKTVRKLHMDKCASTRLDAKRQIEYAWAKTFENDFARMCILDEGGDDDDAEGRDSTDIITEEHSSNNFSRSFKKTPRRDRDERHGHHRGGQDSYVSSGFGIGGDVMDMMTDIGAVSAENYAKRKQPRQQSSKKHSSSTRREEEGRGHDERNRSSRSTSKSKERTSSRREQMEVPSHIMEYNAAKVTARKAKAAGASSSGGKEDKKGRSGSGSGTTTATRASKHGSHSSKSKSAGEHSSFSSSKRSFSLGWSLKGRRNNHNNSRKKPEVHIEEPSLLEGIQEEDDDRSFLSNDDDDEDEGLDPAEANFGTPILQFWREKPDGTIVGRESLTMERIRTGEIIRGTLAEGEIVEDKNGMMYYLS